MTTCTRPAAGWLCPRPAGHDGPCPAYRPVDVDELLEEKCRALAYHRGLSFGLVTGIFLTALTFALLHLAGAV